MSLWHNQTEDRLHCGIDVSKKMEVDQAAIEEAHRKVQREYDGMLDAAQSAASRGPIRSSCRCRKPLRPMLPRLEPSTASPIGWEAACRPRVADNIWRADYESVRNDFGHGSTAKP